jgi:hypothetical protein
MTILVGSWAFFMYRDRVRDEFDTLNKKVEGLEKELKPYREVTRPDYTVEDAGNLFMGEFTDDGLFMENLKTATEIYNKAFPKRAQITCYIPITKKGLTPEDLARVDAKINNYVRPPDSEIPRHEGKLLRVKQENGKFVLYDVTNEVQRYQDALNESDRLQKSGG